MLVGWIRPMTSVPLNADAVSLLVWLELREFAQLPSQAEMQRQAVQSQDRRQRFSTRAARLVGVEEMPFASRRCV